MRYGSSDYECKIEQPFYNSNKAQLQNPMIVSIFEIPIIRFIYIRMFLILGFLFDGVV